jgi:hypothetical protein
MEMKAEEGDYREQQQAVIPHWRKHVPGRNVGIGRDMLTPGRYHAHPP